MLGSTIRGLWISYRRNIGDHGNRIDHGDRVVPLPFQGVLQDKSGVLAGQSGPSDDGLGHDLLPTCVFDFSVDSTVDSICTTHAAAASSWPCLRQPQAIVFNVASYTPTGTDLQAHLDRIRASAHKSSTKHDLDTVVVVPSGLAPLPRQAQRGGFALEQVHADVADRCHDGRGVAFADAADIYAEQTTSRCPCSWFSAPQCPRTACAKRCASAPMELRKKRLSKVWMSPIEQTRSTMPMLRRPNHCAIL